MGVKLCKESSVWFGAILRGDTELITIGEEAMFKTDQFYTDMGFPLVIGKDVTIGHSNASWMHYWRWKSNRN